ncbi:MAG TPA: site-specific DNA-methyltransferase [Gaiellaceae bacterium]|nr:site-specific DNA-methyltransferase [Gaiellaceae bacterium]
MSSSASPPAPSRALHAREQNRRFLEENCIYEGDARKLMHRTEPESIALSIWSPPYFVGKSYERDLSFDDWTKLIRAVIGGHARALVPGGFVAINIADILCFADPGIPRVQADVVSTKRSPVTREMVLEAKAQHPGSSRYELAALLGCSEQTVDRRLNHNNVRGGKYATQTKVRTVAGLIESWAEAAGLFLYDRRIWVKDPAWANSRWHSLSYRAVDEFEYVFILWKPGITKVDRRRLSPAEWRAWGSRGMWDIPSVRANDDHEAKFPVELPRRLIRLLSEPGDVVLDPFIGSGTTAVAAIELSRGFMGFELLPEYVQLARKAVARARDGIGDERDHLARERGETHAVA